MNDNRINYTQVIWEITCLLQGAESLEEALRTSLEEVVKAVDAEAGTIWFYNASGDKRIYPSFWIGGADLTGLSLACGEGIAGTVVQDAKTTVVKDCQSDARWAGRFDAATGFVTKSMICVPLTNKYETIGCIQIINKKDGSLYTDDDVSLAENLAMLTAIAIEGKGLNLGFTGEKKALMSLRDVSKTTMRGEHERTLLCGLNLDVLEGELLVMCGESGCGKSAIFGILGGLDGLSGGSFTFDGKDYSGADENMLTDYRRSCVGVVCPDGCLVDGMTVTENLELAAAACKKPMAVKTVLEAVGLTELADEKAGAISDGARRILSLAQALVKQPRVLLADELTASLDRETATEVLAVLEKIVKGGTTAVLVTHNEEIGKMADRMIRIRGGQASEVVVNSRRMSAKELAW